MLLLYFSFGQLITDCHDGVTEEGTKGSSRSKRLLCLARRRPSASSLAERGKVLLLPKKITDVIEQQP